MVLPASRGMAEKGAELTRGVNWSAGAHQGKGAGRRANLHPAAPSQEAGGSHQEAHGASSGARGARGVGAGTRACVAVSDAARTTQCRDLSHSTAGLSRSSYRERPERLIIDTAAAGGRRQQEQWRFRYPSGAKREGTAAAEAPDKCPPPPPRALRIDQAAASFCVPVGRPPWPTGVLGALQAGPRWTLSEDLGGVLERTQVVRPALGGIRFSKDAPRLSPLDPFCCSLGSWCRTRGRCGCCCS